VTGLLTKKGMSRYRAKP